MGNLINAYFSHSKLYDNASIYFVLYWFSFGLKTTDFFFGGLLYLIVMFQNHFRAPHFFLRHCGSFVVMYMCRYCPPIKNDHHIILSRGISYICICRILYLIYDCWQFEKCVCCGDVWFDDSMTKMHSMLLTKKIDLYIFSFLQITKKKGKEKPLLRRKSELPHDISMIRALESHKRSEEYLSTSAESQSANWDTKYMTLCHIEDHNATK